MAVCHQRQTKTRSPRVTAQPKFGLRWVPSRQISRAYRDVLSPIIGFLAATQLANILQGPQRADAPVILKFHDFFLAMAAMRLTISGEAWWARARRHFW